jgi:hypothetical protein
MLACGAHGLRAAETDWFGITKLHPTIPNGREWHAQWEQARVLRPYELDPADKLFCFVETFFEQRRHPRG